MNGGREILWVALPFAIGVLSASLFLQSASISSSLFPPLITGVCLTSLMARPSDRISDRTRLVLICLSCFSTGLLCHRTAYLTDISSTLSSSIITSYASAFCKELGNIIDSLPFEDSETSSLLKALITGDRASLSKETTASFRQSGASHILALSGMHLGILYGIFRKTLSLLGNSRAVKAIRSSILLAICGFYTLATGAGESITRAFLFILLNETASLSFRRHTLRDILPAALIIQLTIDPLSVSSVSFQLSYAAMAGIAYINPTLKRFWPEDNGGGLAKAVRKIWDTSSLSISCQITTAPLAWYYFRSFPQYFLLTNLIAIPLTGMIIPISLPLIFLSWTGWCPEALARITETLISTLIQTLGIIAGM